MEAEAGQDRQPRLTRCQFFQGAQLVRSETQFVYFFVSLVELVHYSFINIAENSHNFMDFFLGVSFHKTSSLFF
jgi:hypothetical protein